ncbi:MAG: hypothetical protein ACE5NP_13675 [Anaerolineae bacterium]
MKDNKLKITIYRFTGKQLFFTVPERFCEECDLTIGLVKRVIAELGLDVELEVKPWFNYLFEALLKGAWHPPAVFIGQKMLSQGIVPDPEALREELLTSLARPADSTA